MDATVALNPAQGRTVMSKSIALGLLGAGAKPVAVLLAGCTGAPSHTASDGAAPTPAATSQPGAHARTDA